MKKTLYMLIGPKGSGKTHIGTLVNAHTDITFLRVESIWLGVPPGEDGWKQVEDAIDAEFQTRDQVMVESLGAGDDFKRYYASLKGKYTVRMIRVRADLDTCLARVRKRGSADHIPVPDDKVMEYNRIAAAVSYNWDLEIDNNAPAPDEEILNAILSMNR
jgi:shikimate kinase